jgi:Tol biopolymer transport system component
VRRVIDAPGLDGSPAWTPDGTALYFHSERDERLPYRIFSVNLRGGDPQPITPDDVPALAPVLRTDGRILFSTRPPQAGSGARQVRSAPSASG